MPDKKDFPKLNTQARVDFYKKNNLKMDATTELPKEKAVKTKPTPKTRKKPTANEMKPDATNVPKLDLDKAKKASDNDAIDLYEDARDGMKKTRLKIQQQGYDRDQITKEDKKRDKALESGANAKQYDTDKTTKAIKDYQLERKDNQSIAKMMKKVKNSCSSSPAAALTFQPKTNINSGMNSPPKPSATGGAVTPEDSSSDDEPWGIWSEKNIEKRKNNKKTKKEFRSLVK